MKMQLRHLLVHTRRSVEQIQFSEVVTFIHGPVSTGKSTVARLVDYCQDVLRRCSDGVPNSH